LDGRIPRARIDSGNDAGNLVEFNNRRGWISPRFFDGQTNIAALALGKEGSVKAPNSLNISTALRKAQLTGIVNGDHGVAYERKPTLLMPNMPTWESGSSSISAV
jgi:hypothetical protein